MDGMKLINGSVQGAESFRESLSQRTDQLKVDGESFADSLKTAINSVDKLQKEADVKMQELATGKTQSIHETMIAAEKADLALRLMVQVRNKIIDAYQEIMKMQV